MMLDKKLIYLQSYLSQKQPTVELHEYIGVSKRQLSRLIASWQEAGYITYTGGLGRGNKLEISMVIDAEKEIFHYAIANAKNMELNDLRDYINLPWHDESRESIIDALNTEFYSENQSQGFLMDYVYDIPNNLNKAKVHDVVNNQVCDSIGETLYTCKDNQLHRQLVKFDEWIGNSLHLHLTKDSYFDDKVQLKSEHVASVLYTLYKSKEYKLYFQMINKVEVVNDFHLIVHCTHKAEHLKMLLSEPITAILREEEGSLHGTGKYYVLKHTENEIVLSANPYHRRQPQIKKVFLMKNRTKKVEEFSKQIQKSDVKYYIGNGLLVCNPNTKLDKPQRNYFCKVFLNYLKVLLENEESEIEWLYEDINSNRVNDMPTIKFVSSEYNYDVFQTIFDNMNQVFGIEVIHKMLPYNQYLTTHLDDIDVDFIFMLETYIRQNPLKLYSMLMHCKCKDWLLQMPDCKSFIEGFSVESMDQMKIFSDTKLQWLKQECLLLEAYLKHKSYRLPSYINYLEINKYGYIDYGSIIIE